MFGLELVAEVLYVPREPLPYYALGLGRIERAVVPVPAAVTVRHAIRRHIQPDLAQDRGQVFVEALELAHEVDEQLSVFGCQVIQLVTRKRVDRAPDPELPHASRYELLEGGRGRGDFQPVNRLGTASAPIAC